MKRNRTFIHVRRFALLTHLTEITVLIFASADALFFCKAKRIGIIKLDFFAYETRRALLSLTLGHSTYGVCKNLHQTFSLYKVFTCLTGM